MTTEHKPHTKAEREAERAWARCEREALRADAAETSEDELRIRVAELERALRAIRKALENIE